MVTKLPTAAQSPKLNGSHLRGFLLFTDGIFDGMTFRPYTPEDRVAKTMPFNFPDFRAGDTGYAAGKMNLGGEGFRRFTVVSNDEIAALVGRVLGKAIELWKAGYETAESLAEDLQELEQKSPLFHVFFGLTEDFGQR